MNWIIFSLIAALIYTATYFIDKFFITNLKNSYLATVTSCFGNGTIFLLASLFFLKNYHFSAGAIAIGIVAGLINTTSILLYYYILSKEEVSRYVPILSLKPFIVIILSFFLLQESFSAIVYFGMFLVLLGSFVISVKKLDKIQVLKSTLGLGIMSAFLFGFRDVVIKMGTNVTDVWVINFWIGVSLYASGIILYLYKGQPKNNSEKSLAKKLLGINMVSALAFIAISLALKSGPASIVASLLQTKLIFTFITAFILSIIWPRTFKEDISRFTLVQKFIATVLVATGVLLII